MSWGVFPDGRTGLSSLLDPLLESSLLDPLESSLLVPLLESSLLDPLLKSSSLSMNMSYLQLSVSQSVRLSVAGCLYVLSVSVSYFNITLPNTLSPSKWSHF